MITYKIHKGHVAWTNIGQMKCYNLFETYMVIMATVIDSVDARQSCIDDMTKQYKSKSTSQCGWGRGIVLGLHCYLH